MSSSNAHLLVVDDNPATRYSTSRVLRGAGWTVSEAESGEEAMELFRQGVDLIILDVNLPDIDGFEVCRRIRAGETYPRTAVLHLSATYVQDADKVQGLESGADAYLTHPMDPPVLIATVKAFLRARQAEIAFRDSEARFAAVFENALNGVAVLDESSRFVDVNPALLKILRRSRLDVIQRGLFDFVPEGHQGQVQEVLEELERSQAWRGHFPLKDANHDLVWLEWHMSTHAEPGLRLAIVSDVTEKLRYEEERESLLQSERAAREEAEQANRLKDEFLATVSHELRNPLNAIVGWSQLLNMGGIDAETLKEGLTTIERNAMAQSQMICDLLDVARITSGKIRLDVQTLYPAETLEAAISAVQPAADAMEIRLIRTFDEHAGPIYGDPSRLQQVFWNLLSNAVKFTPKRGKVHIVLQRVNSHVEIRMEDTGSGMSEEFLTQIFERFRQADATTTREHGGLGLGLAITKQLVEMHGGSIHAASEGLGKGSTFTVMLPVTASRDDAQAAVSDDGQTQNGIDELATTRPLAQLRVLVVEDDPDSRALLKRLVSAAGAEAQDAGSVGEALRLVEEFQPQVLVSDLGMPGRDGFELIREVRALGHTFQTLPAVALTAFARADDRRKSLLAGFQLHLSKPVDPRELTAAIASLAGRTGVAPSS